MESVSQPEDTSIIKDVDTKPEKKDTANKIKKEVKKPQKKVDAKEGTKKVIQESTKPEKEKAPQIEAEKITPELKQEEKKAKDWGRASNDPRNKS